MRNLDLSPLYRSTVGFDRLGSMLDQLLSGETAVPSYPPYNIERLDDDHYRISIAVAGFRDEDLNVEVKDQTLTVTAKKREVPEDRQPVYLYRGIAERGFERRFQLADHVKVTAARLEYGLLHIDLMREVPEALRPRTIPIAPAGKGGNGTTSA
ncbi:MAG TPA: Hsp20 family protein [Thermohalobaculum sp.]|nr:Hsp20 family protein [Thermohalobaculum sp.]